MKRGRPGIGADKEARIVALAREGKTDVGIAVALGVSKSTVGSYRKRLVPGSRLKDRILSLLRDGLTPRQIALVLNIPAKRVSYYGRAYLPDLRVRRGRPPEVF